MHHSDRGVQYASNAYVDTLKKAGIQISMSRRGKGLSRILCNWQFHVMGTLSSYMMTNWLMAAVQWTRGRVHLRDRLSRAR